MTDTPETPSQHMNQLIRDMAEKAPEQRRALRRHLINQATRTEKENNRG